MENIKFINDKCKEYKEKHISRDYLSGLPSEKAQGSEVKKKDEKERSKQQFCPKVIGKKIRIASPTYVPSTTTNQVNNMQPQESTTISDLTPPEPNLVPNLNLSYLNSAHQSLWPSTQSNFFFIMKNLWS